MPALAVRVSALAPEDAMRLGAAGNRQAPSVCGTSRCAALCLLGSLCLVRRAALRLLGAGAARPGPLRLQQGVPAERGQGWRGPLRLQRRRV